MKLISEQFISRGNPSRTTDPQERTQAMGDAIVTASAPGTAATTLAGEGQYVPVPARRPATTTTVGVRKPSTKSQIDGLRRKLRDEK
jgi:hypothetical protein